MIVYYHYRFFLKTRSSEDGGIRKSNGPGLAYLGAGYAQCCLFRGWLCTHTGNIFNAHTIGEPTCNSQGTFIPTSFFCKISPKSSSTFVIVFSFFWTIEAEQGAMALNWWQHAAIYCYCWRKKTCVRWKEEGGTIPLLENRFELILRGLIRAGSSHTMSPAAKIKTRSGQIYAMPTIGQVGQSENRRGSGQLIMNKRKKHRKNCESYQSQVTWKVKFK